MQPFTPPNRQMIATMALRGLGDIDLAPGITFRNDDAYRDFTQGVSLTQNRRWSPVPPTLIQDVRLALQDAQITRDTRRRILGENFVTTAEFSTRQIDDLQHWNTIFGRTETRDSAFLDAMKSFKDSMLSFTAAYQAPAPGFVSPTGSAPSTGVQATPPMSPTDTTLAEIFAASQQQAAEAKAAAEAIAEAAKQKQGQQTLVIGGVVAAAVVLGGVLFLTRRK